MSTQHRTIGRDPSCDLVLDGPGVSRLHARLSRDDGHCLWIEDAGSANGLRLQRNRQWIPVRRVTLCVGDRLRLGETEVPLDRLTMLFGGDESVRLQPMRLPSLAQMKALDEPSPAASSRGRLVRNPLTGAIEEAE